MKNIEAYVISNIGNVRDNHEDNFFVPKDNFINFDKQKEIKSSELSVEHEYLGKDGVFVVCDGMGGHNAGEVASRIAIETVLSKYDELLTDKKEKLLEFIKYVNNLICDTSKKNANCSNMGTTFSGLVFVNEKCNLLHVGDSRIYKFCNNELKQISKDHTEGCRLVEAGIIKKEDLENFPNRKSLYKYLGRDGELIADCELIDISTKSRFIIASDGLSDTLSYDDIADSVSKIESEKELCHDLINKCLSKGTKCSDNVTIICIDVK